jgi:hypothetical protein
MSVFDLLKANGAEFNGDKITISCRSMSIVLDKYARDGVVSELQDLLDRTTSKSYFPTILRERINRYKNKQHGTEG